MAFQVGIFDQAKMGVLRRYCPTSAVLSLPEVSLEELGASGIQLIMLDVDHTLVKWGEEEFSQPVLDWVAKAKEMGFLLAILSNTRHPQRLGRLSERLDVKAFRGKFKPNPAIYFEAMREFGASPSMSVMIGDQIMTDIVGANRAGVKSIWLKKMDGPEFFGTKFNRVLEHVVSGFFKKVRA